MAREKGTKKPLTDAEQKKSVADYIANDGNASETARQNNVSDDTVLRLVKRRGDIVELLEQKRAENTASVERYMEANANRVCDIINQGLELITQRLDECTPVQAATIMGILIDKHKGVNTQRIEMSANMSLSDKLEAIKQAAADYNKHGH